MTAAPLNPSGHNEGLGFVRLMMVLSGLSPLFLLWAIRGMTSVSDRRLWALCAILLLVPTAALFLRLRVARFRNDVRALVIGKADDHREHLLVYLFAMLIPLYDVNVADTREAIAAVTALLFIVFLFWHLNLHYMNIFFAIGGYRVFTVTPTNSGLGTGEPFVLLTRRAALATGETIRAYRLSNSVFFEPKVAL